MLFLGMGILLLSLASREGIALPVKGDDILPLFCAEGYLGNDYTFLFNNEDIDEVIFKGYSDLEDEALKLAIRKYNKE